MSISLTRVAFSSRMLPRAIHPATATTLQVRFISKSKSNLPTHPSPDAPSISKSGSETPSDYDRDRTPLTIYPEDREIGDVTAAATVSGAPIELQARTVRIYKPSKAATQSSHWNGRGWKIDWDVLPKGTAWENPLMGWTSSADFVQGTSLYFKTKEDAILFAEKQGYEYFVQEPNERRFKPKAYAANFTHSPKKLKMILTK